ncbi:uncharacterized protein [Nicotiana tomentosiformis]|uniref:uncharacterized protein n=1 Tax=Nicotiana tomentosiformis TaxID=4098 RepID=UPI00051B833C|nr:uncharacterized protein DDB_G0271670-like [Nicotiana tomentosiformis]
MAVDVCSEIASLVVSPRISFSHDLKETDDIIPIECHHFRSDAFLLESTIDFDFCVTNQSFSQEKISSADELFSNGKILPIEVKKSTPFIEINQSEPQQLRLTSKQVGIGYMSEPQSLQQQQSEQQLHLGAKQVGVGYMFESQYLQQQQYEPQQQLCLGPKQVGVGYMSEPQSLHQQQSESQLLRFSPKQVGIGYMSEAQSLQVKPAAPVLETATNVDTKKRLKEFLSSNCDEEIEKPQAKPFWQFRRSNSLNCENGRSNGLKWSSLQFLSRSNSTGSVPNQKNSKIFQKQNSQKEQIKVLRKSSSLSSSSTSSSSSSSSSSFSSFNQSHSLHSSSKRAQSRPLKKSFSRSYGNGIHVSPVLNLPHTYISKGTVCLFGLGSLFCNGKSKKKK